MGSRGGASEKNWRELDFLVGENEHGWHTEFVKTKQARVKKVSDIQQILLSLVQQIYLHVPSVSVCQDIIVNTIKEVLVFMEVLVCFCVNIHYFNLLLPSPPLLHTSTCTI